jgi:hypothetical protein
MEFQQVTPANVSIEGLLNREALTDEHACAFMQ